jgi:hypothetical protein
VSTNLNQPLPRTLGEDRVAHRQPDVLVAAVVGAAVRIGLRLEIGLGLGRYDPITLLALVQLR